jgi:hypothetical protein
MYVSHVLNHLVSPHEAVLAASMATWMLAVDHLRRGSRMYSGDVSLKVSFPFESFALAGTRLPETIEECTVGFCQRVPAVWSKDEIISYDEEASSDFGDSCSGC